MNKKNQLIFIHGGLGWGIPFSLFISALRWIENKPPAFGSYFILIIISIIGGIAWGYFMYKSGPQRENIDFSTSIFLKSITLALIILSIYGVIFRYLLTPNNLDDTLWSTCSFISIILIGILIQHKFILGNSKK
ncbi:MULTISPECIES: hypothetical protein [unclassified Acinetobacter]|uniref:hypothetical protein n=1 Tax=unclassified Acinetobacter TaxID=196816 RepID=UPI0029341BBB|nr:MULTISPECIES: hypothetical protein [unclassified Acinetobacter]WOE33247.1 hypothetical protein QSG84_15905 [Acinetobacter sp. SAAs470]WOE36972.1 hypothetical protein QSG86_00980 [Acinetobacter sp. SAAs474]